MRRLFIVAIVIAVVGVTAHILTVWTTPRLVMRTAWDRVSALYGVNKVGRPALPTAASRGVVMPSPDLLYAVCAFDLKRGYLRVKAKVPPGYWSLAVYAMNTDAIWSVNDRETGEGLVEILIAPKDAAVPVTGDKVRLVRARETRGLVLIRTLVRDRANMGDQKAAQDSVSCTLQPWAKK